MLNKSSEYALRAMIFVRLQNLSGKRPGVPEIAREIDAPKAFAAKILHILTTHKLLVSMKGRSGGFYIEEDKSNLMLVDLIRVTEGDHLFHKCVIGLKECSDDNPCPLHDQYKEIRDGILKIFKEETIHTLALKLLDGTAVLHRLGKTNEDVK